MPHVAHSTVAAGAYYSRLGRTDLAQIHKAILCTDTSARVGPLYGNFSGWCSPYERGRRKPRPVELKRTRTVTGGGQRELKFSQGRLKILPTVFAKKIPPSLYYLHPLPYRARRSAYRAFGSTWRLYYDASINLFTVHASANGRVLWVDEYYWNALRCFIGMKLSSKSLLTAYGK